MRCRRGSRPRAPFPRRGRTGRGPTAAIRPHRAVSPPANSTPPHPLPSGYGYAHPHCKPPARRAPVRRRGEPGLHLGGELRAGRRRGHALGERHREVGGLEVDDDVPAQRGDLRVCAGGSGARMKRPRRPGLATCSDECASKQCSY